MNHKRKRPKNARGGCLMCKRNKINGGRDHELGCRGWGKLRDEAHARVDLAAALRRS